MRTLAILFFLVISCSQLSAVDYNKLRNVLIKQPAPFGYPIAIDVIQGKSGDEPVFVCFHGTGSDHTLGALVASFGVTNDHIISFNFPDYDMFGRGISFLDSSYGTINELLPALYILKKIAVDAGASKISIYGFSSGAGDAVNVVAILNSNIYDRALNGIGITANDKKLILAALQRGVLLLDSPLKSKEEVYESGIGQRDRASIAMAKRYRDNQLVPIESIYLLKGLTLTTVVFFQTPDDRVANRDDSLFASRLKESNPNGKNIAIMKDEGGHCGYHKSLWEAYRSLNPPSDVVK